MNGRKPSLLVRAAARLLRPVVAEIERQERERDPHRAMCEAIRRRILGSPAVGEAGLEILTVHRAEETAAVAAAVVIKADGTGLRPLIGPAK